MARKTAGAETPEEKLQRMEAARLRSVKENMAALPTEDVEDLLFAGERELARRDPDNDEQSDLLHIGEILDDIEEASVTWGKVGGISTGYPELDAMIGGLKKSEVTLVAGESNNGKSAMIAAMVSRVAKNVPTLYITLEMQPRSVGARLKYACGNNKEYQELQIYFQRTFRIDYRSLEPLFKKAIDEGCKVAVLDYLQYMGVGMKNEEVAKMSRIMCSLSLQYDIPFIIVVSLRKSDGKRKWTNITLEDIMGTGAIGYDADNVLLVSRRDNGDNYDQSGIWVKHLKSRDMPVDYSNPYLRFSWYKTKITSDTNYIADEFSEQYRAAMEEYAQRIKPKQQNILDGGTPVDLSDIPF